ncbi:hypothetical protein [Sagittula sp. S175]|uniref:hypothetical protein n=1 Tax=Sagittula sp. S175 TaxID=3415129 RepID=UPI003C7D92F4
MRVGMTVGLVSALALAACGSGGPFAPKATVAEAPAQQVAADQARPQARPEGAAAPKPPANARTAAQFDTVSVEEKKAAAAAPEDPSAEKALGDTIASLGDPSKPGLWLETPLVSKAQTGRVAFNGKSAKVDLIPIDGPKTAGSRISLSAMQLIGAPLTDLPTIQVFAGG